MRAVFTLSDCNGCRGYRAPCRGTVRAEFAGCSRFTMICHMVLPVWAQLKYRRFRATAFAILLIARPLAAQDSADTPEARAERAFARNDCPTALLLYPSALERAQAAHDYGRLGLFYRRTGICYNRMGDPESALTAYRAGTAAAESAGDIDLQEENIHGAQLALQRLSRFSESLAEAHRELALAEQCRHPQHLVRALSAVGNVNRAVGQTGLAVQFYQRILDYSRGANFDEGIRFGLDSLAQMSSALGDPETGLRYLRQVLAVTQPDDAVAMARAHNNVGDALLALNRLKEAQAEFEAGLRFAEAPEAWMARQIILLNLGGVHHGLKQYQQARLRYQQVIELSEQHKDSDTECRSKTALSAALFDAGDAVAAEREARAAVNIARRIDNPERLFQSLGQLGTILESAGRTEEAFAASRNRRASWNRCGPRRPATRRLWRPSFGRASGSTRRWSSTFWINAGTKKPCAGRSGRRHAC